MRCRGFDFARVGGLAKRSGPDCFGARLAVIRSLVKISKLCPWLIFGADLGARVKYVLFLLEVGLSCRAAGLKEPGVGMKTGAGATADASARQAEGRLQKEKRRSSGPV